MTDSIECAFAGRVGQEPVMRTAKTGKTWCSFSVAVGKDDDDGGVQWVSISVFSDTAIAAPSTLATR